MTGGASSSLSDQMKRWALFWFEFSFFCKSEWRANDYRGIAFGGTSHWRANFLWVSLTPRSTCIIATFLPRTPPWRLQFKALQKCWASTSMSVLRHHQYRPCYGRVASAAATQQMVAPLPQGRRRRRRPRSTSTLARRPTSAPSVASAAAASPRQRNHCMLLHEFSILHACNYIQLHACNYMPLHDHYMHVIACNCLN